MKHLLLLISIPLFALTALSQEISLAGQWRFAIDRTDKGIGEKWFSTTLGDKINLPGSMAENGKGDDITLKTQWTGSIYDSSFYFSPRFEKYRQPGNIHIPFWLTPAKHYVGAAWYQKDIKIPAGWKGKQIVLHLERAHTETRVWVDGKEIGMQNSLVAPHEYDLSVKLSPGTHRITIRVDNRIKEINVGPDSHSISDHTQGNWNGIIGKLFLKAVPSVYFNDVQVFPDLKSRKARVRLIIQSSGKTTASAKISISANSFNAALQDKTPVVEAIISLHGGDRDTIDLNLPFSNTMQTWDEFHPTLYNLRAIVKTKEGEDVKRVQFGMREFRIEGRNFLINDRPVFLRGTLNNCEFPLTGYPPTDVASWIRIMKTAKSHGLNHIRFHSWCPPEAAFVAADQEGVYLQPEGPSWPNHGPKIGLGQPIDSFLFNETNRMVSAYGNHPSFCMLSAGNEPAGNQVKYLNAFVDYWKAKDDRRVYTGMSVGGSWPVVPNAQYQVRGGVRGLAWDKRPETESDFTAGIAKFDVPFVAHEIGQYCVFPDFNEIKDYTGVYRAKNFELFRQDLSDHGMLKQAHDFMMASGKLQALCYKTEIEKMLRTPGYAGFQMLGLQDFPGQGTALVGVLNSFWKEKGYISAAEYARFCNAIVPLASLPKFVFTNDETLTAKITVSNWSATPLDHPEFQWTLKTTAGQFLSKGSFIPGQIGFGNNQLAGQIEFSLKDISKATQLKLEVKMLHTTIANDWNVWVYPAKEELTATGIYYTTSLDEKAQEILLNGGKVFLNAAGKVVKGKEVSMYFQPVFWNTSWFQMKPPHVTGMLIQEKSNAFADFPTNYYSDLQWWDIQNRSQVMILEDFPEGFTPLVQPIDTWFINRRLALIYEARVGKGKIIVSSADLRADIDNAASRQLFRSLQQYMASDKFNPRHEISFDVMKDVFITPSREQYKIYTSESPDELKPNSTKNKN